MLRIPEKELGRHGYRMPKRHNIPLHRSLDRKRPHSGDLTIKYSDFFSEDLMEASETLDTADLFN